MLLELAVMDGACFVTVANFVGVCYGRHFGIGLQRIEAIAFKYGDSGETGIWIYDLYLGG
jgi:hypothetical protein